MTDAFQSEFPVTKREIAEKSYQYQKEWRFEREKSLMKHALALFPHWGYPHKRLEWHSRPEFHREPKMSKTQPRIPLNLPRDPLHIPKQETLDSLCFVTGADSQAPYFNLCVQLLESIKATRWYNNIPIKVLDCGLNAEDKNYLIQRFNVEVKDPGWDMDINFVRNIKIGWKGLTARPYFNKHFPGYQYYFWVDTDSWIQNEKVFDRFVCLCEKQGLAMINEWDLKWDKRGVTLPRCFPNAIPHHYIDDAHMLDKTLLCNGFYCISSDLNMKYSAYCDAAINEKKQYLWGFDMAMLNYCFYKHVNGDIFNEHFHYYSRMAPLGAHINADKNILTLDGEMVDGVSLTVNLKHSPIRMLFPNSNKQRNRSLSETAKHLSLKLPAASEEQAHTMCLNEKLQQGTFFYRIYLKPEDLYGTIEEIIQ